MQIVLRGVLTICHQHDNFGNAPFGIGERTVIKGGVHFAIRNQVVQRTLQRRVQQQRAPFHAKVDRGIAACVQPVDLRPQRSMGVAIGQDLAPVLQFAGPVARGPIPASPGVEMPSALQHQCRVQQIKRGYLEVLFFPVNAVRTGVLACHRIIRIQNLKAVQQGRSGHHLFGIGDQADRYFPSFDRTVGGLGPVSRVTLQNVHELLGRAAQLIDF